MTNKNNHNPNIVLLSYFGIIIFSIQSMLTSMFHIIIFQKDNFIAYFTADNAEWKY